MPEMSLSPVLYRTIALQADGKILVGGNFVEIGGQTRFRLARLDPATGLADSFDPTQSSFVQAIAVQADGKILLGGMFTYHRRTSARCTSPGSIPPPAWQIRSTRTHRILSMKLQSRRTEKSWRLACSPRSERTGRKPNAQPHRASGNRRHGRPDARSQPSQQQLCDRHRRAAGRQDSYRRRLFQRFGRAAQRDCAIERGRHARHRFRPETWILRSTSIIVQADGKILVGGGFTSIGGETRNRIARLDPVTGPLIRSIPT